MAERYIVLPPPGGEKVETPTFGARARDRKFSTDLGALRMEDLQWQRPRPRRAVQRPVPVVAELPDGSAKLVEVPEGKAEQLRLPTPGSRLVPEQLYRPASPLEEEPPSPLSGGAAATQFEVRCATTSIPLQGATVTAFLDSKTRVGGQGVTDAAGRVELSLGGNPVTLDLLRVKPPPHGWWGASAQQLRIDSPHSVSLSPVDLAHSAPDVLRHFYPKSSRAGDGHGVRVGVIDTGVGPHPDLVLQDGANTVSTEEEGLYSDNGMGHGTHVAGIIAARGSAPTGLEGLAPGAKLWSFRVYPQSSSRASNFDIYAAIVLALRAKCDVLNLSFEAPKLDAALEEAVARAHAQGAVVIAAAGNGGRKPVATPARYGVAVTALGRRGTFPVGGLEESYIAGPEGSDPMDFLAEFSNLGKEIWLTAPGVGVVSTVLGGYGPAGGTSMAAAAATGTTARLLSARPDILSMPRNAQRTAAVHNLLGASARSMGFGLEAEGYGML